MWMAVVSRTTAPKKVCPSLDPQNETLFGKKVFSNVIKNLKIRSSWV